MCKLHLSNTLTNKTPIKFCQREAQERQLKAEERKHYFSLFLLSSSSAFVVMNSGKQRQTSECPLKKQVSSSVDGNQTVSSVRWTTSAGLVSSSAPRRYCGSRPATVAVGKRTLPGSRVESRGAGSWFAAGFVSNSSSRRGFSLYVP